MLVSEYPVAIIYRMNQRAPRMEKIWRCVFPGLQSIFGIHVDFLRAVKGGFFLKKKPPYSTLETPRELENRSETAGKSQSLLPFFCCGP
jgi:hypothetical protein